MERLGYDAHGLDLSSNSIQEARSKASNPTHFQIGDMRSFASDLGWESQFDVVTCLFTSFGYFEDEADQLRTLVQIRRALKPGGSLVLDFLNAPYVEHHLVTEECAVKGLSDGRQMEFLIHRRIFNGWIEKSIQFVDASGATQHHVERVRALHLNDLKAMFKQAGFDVTHVFGDYLLKAHSDLSNRCILVAS
jgi:SAM-dependent methyltransferase